MTNMQSTTNTLPNYLFATVEKHQLDSVLNKLKEVKYIKWFGRTSGRFDVVASFKGNDLQSTDAAIKEIRSINGVVATTAMVPFEGQSSPIANDQRAMGQVFLSVDRPIQEVIQSLNKISGVTEALAISGQWEIQTGQSYRVKSSQMWHPWEIMATVRGQSYEDIFAKTIQEISQISGILTSETTFVYKPTVVAA